MATKEMTSEERDEYWASVKRGEAQVGCTSPRAHERPAYSPCPACTERMLDLMKIHPDKGPWVVQTWKDGRVVLMSDDFRHDVALVITGDFWDDDQKRGYAALLADKLNKE